jgi:two-component system OmpR family sensor kinase
MSGRDRLRNLSRRAGSTSRTIVLLVVVVFAGFAITAYLAVHNTKDRLVDELDRRLFDDTRSTIAGMQLEPSLAVDEIGKAFGGRQALLLVDQNGNITNQYPAGDDDRPAPLPVVPATTELDDRLGQVFETPAVNRDVHYRALATRLNDGTYLLVATPLTATESVTRELAASLRIIVAVVFGILGVFIWAIVRSANRQIDQLIDVADRVGKGDLTARTDAKPIRTETSRLAHALDAMTEQLQQASTVRDESEARLQRFVADASHELRTPLATIRGYAQLQQSGAITDPHQTAIAVARIESEARRMGLLVDELLLLAHLDQHAPVNQEIIDLDRLVTESVADARAVDTTRTIVHEPVRGAVVVSGDRDKLHQVVANFLSNARTHTPPGTVITVAVVAVDSDAHVVVTDDGPGMTPIDASHVFDRFYRAETVRSRATGGTGLGLAIAAGIATAHGGHITVDTELGRGTTFTLSLPLIAQ